MTSSSISRILFYAFIVVSGLAGFSSLFFSIYLYELSGSGELVGLFFSLSSAIRVIGVPFCSSLADLIGRRRVLIILSLVHGLAWMFIAIVSNIHIVMLLALVSSFFSTFEVMMGVAADIHQEERYVLGYSILNILNQVAGGLGSLLGGYWIGRLSYQAGFMISGILVILSTMPLMLMKYRGFAERKPQFFRGLLGNISSVFKTGKSLLIVIGLGNFAGMLTIPFTPIFLKDIIGLSEVELGFLFFVGTISTMVASLALACLSGRIDSKAEVRLLLALYFFGPSLTLSYAFIDSLGLATFIWIIGSLKDGLMFPLLMSFITRSFGRDAIATFFGVLSSLAELIEMPASYVGGYLYDKLVPRSIFYASSLISLATAASFVLLCTSVSKSKEVRDPSFCRLSS